MDRQRSISRGHTDDDRTGNRLGPQKAIKERKRQGEGVEQCFAYELREEGEGDEILVRVQLDEQLRRRAEADGGGEVGDSEGQRPAAVHVAGVAEEPHSRVRPPLQPHLHRRFRFRRHGHL